MPAISKIRLTNVIYEEGRKRYNDEIFHFDGQNGAIVLENGGGKTVLIQTVIQAILPHKNFPDRKVKQTLVLEQAPAHIAIEWIKEEKPRRYVVTAVSLYTKANELDSLRYVYEYVEGDADSIERMPFVKTTDGKKRPADKGEMQEYYSAMKNRSFHAKTFSTISEFSRYIEDQHHIIQNEWENIVKINGAEGGVEKFFDDCKSTNALYDRLLIPTVEHAIAGYEEHSFAKTFEKHRESFRLYKQLKKQIAENEKIQQRLETYVATFATLHEVEKEYTETKGHTKGMWNQLEIEAETLAKEAEKLQQKQNKLEEDRNMFHVKQISYEIAMAEKELQTLEEDVNEMERTLKKVIEKKTEAENKYATLQLTKKQQEKNEAEARIVQLQQQIAEVDESPERTNVEQRLNEARQALLGYFEQEMERLQNEIIEIGYEQNPLEREQEQVHEIYEEMVREGKKIHDDKVKIQARIDIDQEKIESLKQELLANPAQEDVHEKVKSLEAERNQLEESIIHEQEIEYQWSKRIKEEQEKQKAYREQKEQQQQKKITYEMKRKTIEEREQAVLQQLQQVNARWIDETGVYLKQRSFEERVKVELEKLHVEREKLLYEERLARRYVDDYSGQSLFFADNYVAEHVRKWQNQMDYVVTGVEYFDSLPEAEKVRFRSAHVWPITLITTEREKGALLEKVKGMAGHLQFPIVVLTTEEVFETEQYPDMVAPSLWNEHLAPEWFAKWKQTIAETATMATKKREEKEQEINKWQQAEQSLQRFLEEYPNEEYERIKKEQVTCDQEVQRVSHLLQETEENIGECMEKREQAQKKQQEAKAQQQFVDSQLLKGKECLQISHKIKVLQQQARQLLESMNVNERQRQKLVRQLEELQERISECKEQKRDKEKQIDFLKRDDDYQELISYGVRPTYTNQARKGLKKVIADYTSLLQGLSKNIETLVTEKRAKEELAMKLQEDIATLQAEYPTIQAFNHFPLDGEKQLVEALEGKNKFSAQQHQVEKEVVAKRKKRDEQSGTVHTKQDDFKQTFQGFSIMSFTDLLSDVALQLVEEERELVKTATYLQREYKRLTKEQTTVKEAKEWLERQNTLHDFKASYISPIALTEQQQIDWPYQKGEMTKEMIHMLDQARNRLMKEKERVDKEKQQFREFCKSEITDVKMRRMALDGIEYKKTYEDVTTFKENMMNSVRNAIKYANEHIIQSDKQLQTFIHQMYSHLVTVTEELKQIPKKTKVKVGEDWKQIFTFTIPEWEEEAGKVRIRDHVEELVKRLESEQYQNELGEEDTDRVRKDVERWLHTKQLLQIVMAGEPMKVSCRKVTNDNEVTSRSYSWEKSNVWSGGEKWSKNMTLFLGILNYVAEKKKHIQSNIKRHRAVLLDNPFGKASSDHVLGPVFFIAEQLGFQMIALTAHAEGKFLQNYFPIIYSCRLRPTTDGDKQIMTKEAMHHDMHKAYFEDHEPEPMTSIGEEEQMTLFE